MRKIGLYGSLMLMVALPATATGQGPGGPAPVVVAPVIEREVAARQAFVANVTPRRRSVIGSAVDGRVLEFLVDAGQAVKERQPLAQLRTQTIEIEVAGAEAELKLRQAELTELRNGSRPEEIALAEAITRATDAANDYAQAKLARAQRLFTTSSGLSKDEFEAAKAEALTAVAKVAETQSALRLVLEGPRSERIDQAAARVAVQEQIVEGLRDRLSKYTIRSPFDGFVTAELTEAGAWVQQGDPVADVVEIDPVEVEVFVPESSIRFVRQGDPCSIQVEAIPDQTFSGTIDQIVPLADNRSRTFPVRVLVQNPAVDSVHPLLPGMLAKVSLPSGSAKKRLLVHKDALQLGGKTPVVFKVADKKAMIVPVRTGPSLEGWIAIESLTAGDLVTGDLVVTRGNERLRPGQDVLISDRQPPLPE